MTQAGVRQQGHAVRELKPGAEGREGVRRTRRTPPLFKGLRDVHSNDSTDGGCTHARAHTNASLQLSLTHMLRERSSGRRARRGAGTCQRQRKRSEWASICPHQRRRHLPAPVHQEQKQGVRARGDSGKHQRRRSRCKECRQEADESMPAGLSVCPEAV